MYGDDRLKQTTTKNPDTGEPEGRFRERVREILDATWDVRDDAIFAELKELMKLEAAVATHCECINNACPVHGIRAKAS